MKQLNMLLTLLFIGMLAGVFNASAGPGSAITFSTQKSLRFIENKGQVTDQNHHPRPDIDFKLQAGNGLNIFIGAGKIHYQWSKAVKSEPQHADLTAESGTETEMYRMDVRLAGVNPNPELIREGGQAFYENHYGLHTGPNGAKAGSFTRITYKSVYPNIDWVFHINEQGQLEHDFVIHPGGNVTDIQIQYAGATKMQLNEDGGITATTPMGSVKENAPYCFQQDGSAVSGKFILEHNTLSFATATYKGTLIIDPVLEWATYFGGSGTQDVVDAVTGDYQGNVYLTGFTLSTDNIATTGAFQFIYGGSNLASNLGDAYLTKFLCDGSCAWATYYGGIAGERARSISCDPYGNICMAGFTNNNAGQPTLNLATPGSHQDTFGGGKSDLFLVKFNKNGQRIWSTYYGGNGEEAATASGTYYGFSVGCDPNGNICLAANTNSASGIATPGSRQPALSGGLDAFLVKFDSAGNRLWGTYYGGDKNEMGNSLHCDKDGNVYMAGTTSSTNGISSASSHQQNYGTGTSDCFLVKFDAAGRQKWATYYGGNNTDEGHTVYCDTSGHVLLTGRTKSNDQIATPGSYQTINKGGLWDALLVKFDTAGTRQWGTFFGGINQAAPFGFSCISTDVEGNIYMGGIANGLDSITTPGSYQQQVNGGTDGFLVKFDTHGDRKWCTYYGGGAADMISSVYADHFGNVYTAGATQSTTDIASPGSYQTVLGGTQSGFLVRFRESNTLPRPDTITGHTVICAASTHTYTIPPITAAKSYTWTLPPGWTGISTTDSIIITAGSGTDTLRVAANFSCGSSEDRMLAITVIPKTTLTTDAATHCENDSIVLKSATAPGMSWKWLRNDTAITGQTDSLLLVQQRGHYNVVTTTGQCVDTSDTVSIHPLPEPVIIQNENLLHTDALYASYQWYYGTQAITGATQAQYTYTAPGDYRVQVTDSNGCVGISVPFTPVHIGQLSEKHIIRAYPNPAQSMIHITATIPVSVTISSMEGREVMWTNKTDYIDISSLASGLYLLLVADQQGRLVHTEKLVKTARRY